MLSFLIPLKLVQRYENKIDFSRKSVQKHIQIRYTPAISGASLNKLIISETDGTIKYALLWLFLFTHFIETLV